MGEPALADRGAVLMQHPGRVEDLADGGYADADGGQLVDVAGVDRGAGGVLDAQQDAHAAQGALQDRPGPSVSVGLLTNQALQVSGHTGVSWRREPVVHPGVQVMHDVEQDELAVPDRRDRRHRVDAPPGGRLAAAAGSVAADHVDERQLMPVPVGLAQGQVAASRLQHQGALPGAQPARPGGERHLPSADRAPADRTVAAPVLARLCTATCWCGWLPRPGSRGTSRPSVARGGGSERTARS
ncbi:MAG TPA: hypothetical protein VFY84_19065 [Jiangellales bacterium]|nr:hypothetical protein [Jiangellales bacterium]